MKLSLQSCIIANAEAQWCSGVVVVMHAGIRTQDSWVYDTIRYDTIEEINVN